MKQKSTFSLSTDLPEQIAAQAVAIAQALGMPVETAVPQQFQVRAAALAIPVDLNRKPEIYCADGRNTWSNV